MKKSLIAMVLLAALSLGGVIAAHVTIADTADRVVITQYDLTGDPRAPRSRPWNIYRHH